MLWTYVRTYDVYADIKIVDTGAHLIWDNHVWDTVVAAQYEK
jgi:hypothetical protein